MNNTSITSSDWILSSSNHVDLEAVQRLIVLVPTLEVDLAVATRRIWELAKATRAHVQFIGLYNDTEQESSLRRDLVTISALMKNGKVSSEVELIFGKDWVSAVKTRWQSGDMVVCFEEQRAGLSYRPLSQILQSDLNAPVYILTGLYAHSNFPMNWLTQSKAWLGTIAILTGFLLFQIKINGFESGWVTALQAFSVLIEIWLLCAWNSLVG